MIHDLRVEGQAGTDATYDLKGIWVGALGSVLYFWCETLRIFARPGRAREILRVCPKSWTHPARYLGLKASGRYVILH